MGLTEAYFAPFLRLFHLPLGCPMSLCRSCWEEYTVLSRLVFRFSVQIFFYNDGPRSGIASGPSHAVHDSCAELGARLLCFARACVQGVMRRGHFGTVAKAEAFVFWTRSIFEASYYVQHSVSEEQRAPRLRVQWTQNRAPR